jgi:protein O-mannosyl-transferase
MIGNNEGFRSIHRGTWLPLLALATLTLGVYGVSLFNGFVLDDEVIIVKNPLTPGLSNLRTVLFSPDVIKPYYRPLNRATYLADYWIFGMNPMGFHAVNIFIHLLNVLLLYAIGRRVLQGHGAALLAALLFAVHPVNSEAVNFISARNTLLSLFFSLASFLAFMQAKEKGVRWLIFSGLLFFCGLLSKETSLVLIGLIALCILFPLSGAVSEKRRTDLVSLLPYVAAVAVYFGMRIYSLQGMMGISIPDVGLFSRLARNYYIIPQYLRLLVFPADLTVCHSIPDGDLFSPPWFLPVWVALIAVIGLIIGSRNKAALFGLAWCSLNYLPIANIVPIPSESMTERFLYLPAVGVFLLAGAGVARLYAPTKTKPIVLTAVAAIFLSLAAITVSRNLDWRDDYALFTSAVRNNPASSPARYNLGTVLRERGDLSAARQEWETALKLDPGNSDALIQMGTFEAIQGNLHRAEHFYTSALASPPGRADPEKSMAHYNLGKIYEKWQMPQRAMQQYEIFIKVADLYYTEYISDAKQRLARLHGAMPPSSNMK